MTQQLLNDIDHWAGVDIGVSATGDLGRSSGETRTQQRIVRRLVTNPGDYMFHPKYGAGLPAKIGENADLPALRALIRTQVLMEAAVARLPEPEVDLVQINSGFSITIRYTSADTRKPITLSFDVNR
ncbi:phage tail protein [Cupriavidus taiwanensis]|uniref:phage tail protein n=1 Tax=Cupriavidus taiwanensis TaxID=164546 RepID=UPI000E100A9B|nr:phage tail protein [Cupriavidus taiwanensis]SOY56864.1 putative phage tail protein [Cupriavidus taiwanensis]SOY90809.1 putative phage tail protein [Cupriavidus taiwanensis]SOZ63595.1 putative phage tail protein [Cupriavidus taiwanensis]SOZ82617.1 putative phage tail protein [Cupriavidus taiwanensis]SOZ84456.1 putative phage tail protein [Cupriavidus taiwanensis]